MGAFVRRENLHLDEEITKVQQTFAFHGQTFQLYNMVNMAATLYLGYSNQSLCKGFTYQVPMH